MSIDFGSEQRAANRAGQAFINHVRAALHDLPGEPSPDARLDVDRLNSSVFRLRRRATGATESVVVKRLTAAVAERNELVLGRWLPDLGLAHAAPALLGTVTSQSSAFVWQLYEDLGTNVLDGRNPDPRAVGAAVELVAELHTRAAGAALLAECSCHLGDRGIRYFVSNVDDTTNGLEALDALAAAFTPEQRFVRDRLLERLRTLRESVPVRTRVIQGVGGPPTLLHGDLWDINTLVVATSECVQARFIDWDRAGVGPIAYDLSTFLYRFAPNERTWILQQYRDCVGRAGWRLPDPSDLNVLFDTAECARYANRITWPATALLAEGGEAEHRELADILGWFDALAPVLAEG